MKIKVSLQIYKSKENALFHIPIEYEKGIQKYLHKHIDVECVDCKPPISFEAKIRIIKKDGYVNYSIWIPKIFISKIVKSSTKIKYTILLSRK